MKRKKNEEVKKNKIEREDQRKNYGSSLTVYFHIHGPTKPLNEKVAL